jgi:hypothetical protein
MSSALSGLAAGVVAASCLMAGSASADLTYVMGEQGQSCAHACGALGLACEQLNVDHVSPDLFKQASGGKIVCNSTSKAGQWWAPDQPSYVSDPKDPNAGDCLGYVGLPDDQGSFCQAYESAVQRLCACGEDVRVSCFCFLRVL